MKRMVAMKVLDSHFHLWQLSQVPQPWISPETMPAINRDFSAQDYARAISDAVAVLDPALQATVAPDEADRALEFGGGVLVQTITHDLETDYFLQEAAVSSHILGVVGWVNLERLDLDAEIRRLKALPGGGKLVGVRHQIQDEPGNGSLESALFFSGLETLVQHELTFDLIIRADQISAAAQLAEQLPELTFVLDHAGKPNIASRAAQPTAWSEWERSIEELAQLSNVWVKWSGLSTEADWNDWTQSDLEPAWEHLKATFGPERIMWGSDWPVVEVSGGLGKWRAASERFARDLTEDEQRAFWGDNTLAVYGLQRAHDIQNSN